mgnify:CR=1 FL=1
MKTVVVAVSLLLAFAAGCGGNTTKQNNANAGSDPTPTDVSSPTKSNSVFPQPSDQPNVKKYGISSPECRLASEVLMEITQVGLKVASGKLAQSDIAQSFSKVDQLPADIKPIANQIKSLAQGMVGKSAQDSAPLLARWGTALAQLTRATQTVCS